MSAAATFHHWRASMRRRAFAGALCELFGGRSTLLAATPEQWSSCSLQLRLAAIGLLLAAAGCGRGGAPNDSAEDVVPGLRRLTLAYVQYAAANRGVGPADRAIMVKFVMQRDRISKEAAEAYLVSPRDQRPYIVRWGQRPLGSAPLGPDPPAPTILIAEPIGTAGDRYAADGQVSVKKMSDDELARVDPQLVASGK